ncbi:MAG: nucleotide sugar dehydrogenase [Sandaracinaceae bacterium]|nr:nucleotide sugar dehydrogenase [Sandaracinaceae bacterium]
MMRPNPEELPSVAVVGLGYVGSVEAGVLAARGYRVVGVDLREAVVEAVDRGQEPIVEPLLSERLLKGKSLGTLSATTDLADAIFRTRGALVCVGTPRGDDGRLDDTAVLGAVESIAKAVGKGVSYTIVVRSTVPPGFFRRAKTRIADIASANGSQLGLAINPEFLREGSAVRDREEPELIVYASEDDAASAFVESLYADRASRISRVDPESAEMLKLVCNTWHALKVSFANEVARLARPHNVDPFAVMELLCRDTKLNTSSAYLRPGMPFGGACLVKDVASLEAYARDNDVNVPVLAHVLASNRAHLDHLVGAVLEHKPKRVAVIGIGFKAGASDVRDSAPVALVQRLLDHRVEVHVADSSVLDARVPPLGLLALEQSLNDKRAYARESVADAVLHADVVVVGHPCEEDRRTLVRLQPRVVLDVSGELTRALTAEERALLAPRVVLSTPARKAVP